MKSALLCVLRVIRSLLNKLQQDQVSQPFDDRLWVTYWSGGLWCNDPLLMHPGDFTIIRMQGGCNILVQNPGGSLHSLHKMGSLLIFMGVFKELRGCLACFVLSLQKNYKAAQKILRYILTLCSMIVVVTIGNYCQVLNREMKWYAQWTARLGENVGDGGSVAWFILLLVTSW